MVISLLLTNNDNTFDEKGLETIFSIIKSIKYDETKKYSYNMYTADFYHQCHDIDQYDKEYFEELEKARQEENEKIQAEIDKANQEQKRIEEEMENGENKVENVQ